MFFNAVGIIPMNTKPNKNEWPENKTKEAHEEQYLAPKVIQVLSKLRWGHLRRASWWWDNMTIDVNINEQQSNQDQNQKPRSKHHPVASRCSKDRG